MVGGSLAGVSAVESLRESGFDGEITLLDAEAVLPYDKPPLSKGALTDEGAHDQLPLHPRSWYDERGVALRLGRRVVGLDGATRTVYLDGGQELTCDGLVIATGASARDLPVPCPQPGRIHRLRTRDDSRRLRADLTPGRRLVVVGAGFIGLEVAAAARRLGMDVTVVETAATPLSRVFGPRLGEWFRSLHERNGVDVRCGVSLQEVADDGNRFRLRFAAGPALSADVVLAGVGSRRRPSGSGAAGWPSRTESGARAT